SGSARLAASSPSSARSGCQVTMLTSTSRMAHDGGDGAVREPQEAAHEARQARGERPGGADALQLVGQAQALGVFAAQRVLQAAHVLLQLGDPLARLGLEAARLLEILAGTLAQVGEVGELAAEERAVQ